MKKKQKAPARSLASLVTEIRKTLRNDIANIIRRGELLQEAKDQVEHGQWLPWLEENFDMDERTAQRAMAVAKFAAKYDNLSDLRLKKSALYELSSEDYPENVIKAVLKEAESKPVNDSRVYKINEELNPEPGPVEKDIPETDELRERLRGEAEARAEAETEAEEILDGPPPNLPPTDESSGSTDYTLAQFDRAIKALLEVHTSSVGKFVSTDHCVQDLMRVSDFVSAVATMIAHLDGSEDKTKGALSTKPKLPILDVAVAS